MRSPFGLILAALDCGRRPRPNAGEASTNAHDPKHTRRYGASNEVCAAKFAAAAATLAPKTVVDATACVGGNAIAFARRFDRVFALEIDPGRAAMLRHNVAHVRRHAVLGRVDVVAGDCLVELPRLAVDDWATTLVFADPPAAARKRVFAMPSGPASATCTTRDAL